MSILIILVVEKVYDVSFETSIDNKFFETR
jgi:hypothetical protein